MNFVKSIKKVLSGLYSSLKRFPLTIILSTLVAIFLVVISETHPHEDTLTRIAMVLALDIPLSLCIKLFHERRNEETTYKSLISYVIGGLLLFLYYFILLNDLNMIETTRYIAVSLALYLAFIFIPYLPRKEHFEAYVIILFTDFFITLIYSIVLFSGLSAILFTIDKLLGVKISSQFYYYTWLFVVFIFAVSYFLSGVPLKNQDLSAKTYSKPPKILLLYIGMPLLTAYTVILYIYFAKVIVLMQWPNGIVSNLVLWYSVVLTVVLFFITPLKNVDKWANKFLTFSPKIILPVLIMMFISMRIRINAYGVTENRYYVVVFGIWVFFVMLYFSFIKKLTNIIIPVTLSAVSIISVFGPVSSYSISKLSQNNRIEKILVKNNMLDAGNIKPSSNIPKEDKANISSILNYFDNNHSLNDIKYLPKDFKIDDMNRVFGFSFEDINSDTSQEYFYFTRSKLDDLIDISGYDFMVDRRNLMDGSKSNNNLSVSYNMENSIINVKYQGKDLYKKDMNYFINSVIEKHATQPKDNVLPAEEMNFTDENENVKVTFIFRSLSGSINRSSRAIENKEHDYILLIKIK